MSILAAVVFATLATGCGGGGYPGYYGGGNGYGGGYGNGYGGGYGNGYGGGYGGNYYGNNYYRGYGGYPQSGFLGGYAPGHEAWQESGRGRASYGGGWHGAADGRWRRWQRTRRRWTRRCRT